MVPDEVQSVVVVGTVARVRVVLSRTISVYVPRSSAVDAVTVSTTVLGNV